MVVVDSVAVHISVSQHLIRLRTWSGDINVETRGLVDGIALMDSRNGAICTLIVFVEEHDSLGYHWILTKPIAPTPFEHAHYVIAIRNSIRGIFLWETGLVTERRFGFGCEEA